MDRLAVTSLGVAKAHASFRANISDDQSFMKTYRSSVLRGCQERPSGPKTSRDSRGAPNDLFDVCIVRYQDES